MLATSGLGFNRISVEKALAKAASLWKRLASKDYPNGFLLFCSEEVAEVVHPPVPLRRRVYSCSRRFDTSVLQRAIEAETGAVYGAIAIDGAEATFGKVRGLCTASGSAPVVDKAGHITSTTAARTRRGGQSALRYSRLRDESELAFLRKAAETAASLFTDVRGLILAGKADMKHKLSSQLPQALRGQVICSVDLPGSADMDGLRHAAVCATSAAAEKEGRKSEAMLQRFLALTVTSGSEEVLCCYGESQTRAALKLGAVEELLIAKDLDASSTDWKTLASASGASIWEISPRSEAAVQFCQSFAIGACLRWPVCASLLDEDGAFTTEGEPVCRGAASEDAGLGPELPCDSPRMAHCAGACAAPLAGAAAGEHEEATGHVASIPSVVKVEPHGEVLAWLGKELCQTFDSSTAEALSMCVEVILLDEETPVEEALFQATSVLADEGVPRELSESLCSRWQAACESAQFALSLPVDTF